MTNLAVEQLITEISSMDRDGVIGQLREVPYNFPMDFSPDFLASCSLERLRHILLAAYLYAQRAQRAG